MYPFKHHRPATVEDAVALFEAAEDGKFLAGGMTLIPTLKQRLAAPTDIIDLGRIEGLAAISEEAGGVRIGAMTRHAAVADDELVKRLLPGLAQLAAAIGDPQVRSRGAIGGSIANADPAADYPAGLVALGATVRTNRRDIAAEDFFTGFFETALEPGEVILSVFFPAPQRSAYAKFRNPASGYAVVGAFVAVGQDGPRVAITGAAGSVFRWTEAEAALAGSFSADALKGLSVSADELNDDLHASAPYRANLVQVMTHKAVAACQAAWKEASVNRTYKGRREDERLVTGRGRYTTDWSLPGQAHACFVRADRAHARILGIDPSAALSQPGVLLVLTASDIEAAGYKTLNPNMRPVGVDGQPMEVPPRVVLASDKVRFVGEAVALVIAETRNGAIDAAELVMIDYEDLPPVVGARDALAEGAAQIHDLGQGNLGLRFQYGDKAGVEAAFGRAAHVAEVTVAAERIVGNPMEPRSCLASYDAATSAYDLYVSNQGIIPMRAGLAAVTGLPPRSIKVQPIDVGGAFGIRSEAYPEYAALMLASKKVGRPVKWAGTRAETIATDHQGRGSHMTSRLAMDETGRFIGLQIEYLTDVGAWWSGAGPMVNSMAPMGQAVNVYDIPAVYGLHTLAYTNAAPTCAYRGASRPNCSYLMERLVDEAAKVSGIDRVTLRQRNFIPKEAFPYKTATGSVYDSGDPGGLLADVLKESDWDGFETRRASAAARGKLRGIGCAVFISPSGSPGKEQGVVSFGPDGRTVLLSLAGPSGQGHETAYPEVIADILGMEPEAVTLKYGDPDGPPLIGSGSFGSRSMISMGAALATAAHEVVQKGAAMAAEAFGAPLEDIDFEQGLHGRRGGNESVTLQELIDRHVGEPVHPLETLGDLDTATAWPSGAHVAEVEIDPDTGVLQILSYVAVDDCGHIMNHTLVEGQMHGGVMQGVGQVIGEQCLYDPETGQLLTGSFMDYFMPHAHDMPPVFLYDRPVPAPGNLLGAKGAGEAGTTGAIPTLANAVIDALRPAGVEAIDMPYTPNRVWTAINAALG